MFFNTYTTKEISSHELHRQLNEILENYQCNKKINQDKLEKIKAALIASRENACASRYGLTQVKFAETELINAFDRKGKEVEFLNYRYDFKDIPMNHKKSDFPLVLAIEASSICNLKCRMCFQRNKDFTGNPENMGIMSWETYKQLMEQIEQDQLYSAVFASRGEPLLNENIHKMVALAKQKGVIDVKMNTNAVLLTEKVSRNLISAGLDQIVFSVDSVIPQHYETIRGTNFEKVSTNIKRFVEIKNTEFPNSKIKTRVSMVINNIYKEDMEFEVEKSLNYWNGIIDEVAIKSENDFSGIYVDHAVENKKCCDLLWERLYIWYDGTINPCDIDHLSSLKLGSINDKSIAQVWQGLQLNDLRNQHLNNRDNIQCVCRNCVGY